MANFSLLAQLQESRLSSRLASENPPARLEVTESRSGYEGRQLAAFAADLGIPVTFITDAQIALFVPTADKVVVGADTVLADGSIINKSGTTLMALAAHYYGVPFYVCAESFKQSSDNQLSLEEMQAAELGYRQPGVKVRNVYFERVPAELITHWIR
ncbi:MAG: hypothetical protein R3F41_08710 [Gammaproteobacteria bacterium]|nr:hypothetical protein [Pseudomonadales bacterium]MCP5346986.1 hypothetical protein [Pseudomonadales bacterium]